MNWPSQYAIGALFLQKKWALMDEEVLRVKGSCSRSVREYQMCSQSLLELVLAGMRDGISFAKFLPR